MQKILEKRDSPFWKDFFKKVKNSSKKLHYRNQSSKYENNLKGIWNVITEIIGKKKLISRISGKLTVDNKEITDTAFPLISVPPGLLNFETVRWGAYFKVREMKNIKCQNLVIFSFKIRM